MSKGFSSSVSGPIFEQIQKDALGKNRSKEWYRSKLIEYLQQTFSEDDDTPDDESEERGGIEPGEMYFFSYSAAYPEKYPYYDLYPLVYVVEVEESSFLGANLHYLSPTIRPGYARSLINKGDGIIVPNKTIHRYLFSQIQSSFNRVTPTNYEGVSVLPVEQFVDASGDTIVSRKIWRS